MIELEPVSHYDPRYKQMRGRHYIPDRSTIGMQLHYLVKLDDLQVGIISAASPTWAVKPRDDFFGLDTVPGKRGAQLRHIVNNSVFRLEHQEKNLGTKVLALFRRRVTEDWKNTYHVPLCGFETFVEPSECRHGALYRADNWTHVGITKGHAKLQKGIKVNGMGNVERAPTSQKLIFCKWNRKVTALPEVTYKHQFTLDLT